MGFKLNNKVCIFFNITEQNMHLYWVQTGRFWQKESVVCPVWEEAVCCLRWLWCPRNGPAPTLQPGKPTLWLICVPEQAGPARGRRCRRRNSRDMGKRHVERDTVGTWLETYAWEKPLPAGRGSSEGPWPRGNSCHYRDTSEGLTHTITGTTLRGHGLWVPHTRAGTALRDCSLQRTCTRAGMALGDSSSWVTHAAAEEQ